MSPPPPVTGQRQPRRSLGRRLIHTHARGTRGGEESVGRGERRGRARPWRSDSPGPQPHLTQGPRVPVARAPAGPGCGRHFSLRPRGQPGTERLPNTRNRCVGIRGARPHRRPRTDSQGLVGSRSGSPCAGRAASLIHSSKRTHARPLLQSERLLPSGGRARKRRGSGDRREQQSHQMGHLTAFSPNKTGKREHRPHSPGQLGGFRGQLKAARAHSTPIPAPPSLTFLKRRGCKATHFPAWPQTHCSQRLVRSHLENILGKILRYQ